VAPTEQTILPICCSPLASPRVLESCLKPPTNTKGSNRQLPANCEELPILLSIGLAPLNRFLFPVNKGPCWDFVPLWQRRLTGGLCSDFFSCCWLHLWSKFSIIQALLLKV
jgi:hypothetical protein